MMTDVISDREREGIARLLAEPISPDEATFFQLRRARDRGQGSRLAPDQVARFYDLLIANIRDARTTKDDE